MIGVATGSEPWLGGSEQPQQGPSGDADAVALGPGIATSETFASTRQLVQPTDAAAGTLGYADLNLLDLGDMIEASGKVVKYR